ncbi:hypothetical protein ATER59S_02386 [Aquamicrobium terrae]
MSRALVVLDSRFQRQKAAEWCWSLKDGTRVEFKAPQRSDDQNSKMWAMLTEVSVQLKWHGLKLTPDDWKLQFLDALRRAHGDQVRVVPNTDNSGFVNLGTSSSDLSKEEMSDLIELIFKFGAEHGVQFNDPQSSERPPSDEGSADATTSSVGDPAAELSPADEAGTEEGDNPGQVTTEQAAPSSTPIPADWLKSFARMIVAATGVDAQFVVNTSKGAFVGGLSVDQRERARAIVNYALQICRNEIDRDDALEIIAGKALCEVGDLR